MTQKQQQQQQKADKVVLPQIKSQTDMYYIYSANKATPQFSGIKTESSLTRFLVGNIRNI